MDWKKTGKILTLTMFGATVIAALYIMFHGMGLQDSLDFGAGAYYYADIPEFDKYTQSTNYAAKLPFWVYVVLFLAWGALMYKVWKWLDK
jgi:hypothetical protein